MSENLSNSQTSELPGDTKGPNLETTGSASGDGQDISDTVSVINQEDVILNNLLPGDESFLPSKKTTGGEGAKGDITVFNSDNEFVNYVTNSLDTIKSFKKGPALNFPLPNQPAFPVFDKFSKTYFQELGTDVLKPVKKDASGVYCNIPMNMVLLGNDGRLSNTGINPVVNDSSHYKLMANEKNPYIVKTDIRGRMSAKVYPSNISVNVLNKIGQTYDMSTARAWQSVFQLRNESDAMWVLRNKAKSAAVGDNHLLLLFRALCYYFDSLYSQVEGVVPARERQNVQAHHFNILKDVNWVSSISEGSKEIINAIGYPQDFVSFFTYCCMDKPEVYSGMSGPNNEIYRSPFSMYKTKMGTKLVTISDTTPEFNRAVPTWYQKPNTILGFIDMYVSKFGLGSQLNTAFSIVQNLSNLQLFKAPISLPEPIHSTDWFEGQVDAPSVETPIKYLLSSFYVSIIMGITMSRAAILSTFYDMQTLPLSNRSAPRLLDVDLQYAENMWRLITRNQDAVPAFVFNKMIGGDADFLELIGWNYSFINPCHLVPKVTNDMLNVPIHLMLLQSYTASTSIRGVMPINYIWKPVIKRYYDIVEMSYHDFAIMQRLGIIHSTYDQLTDSVTPKLADLPPLLQSNFTVKIRIDIKMADVYTKLHQEGLVIDFRPRNNLTNKVEVVDKDPLDARPLFESWNFGGVNTPTIDTARGGQRGVGYANPVKLVDRNVDQEAMHKAQNRLDNVLRAYAKKLDEKSRVIAENIRNKLFIGEEMASWEYIAFKSVVGGEADCLSNNMVMLPNKHQVPADGDCGWVILKYLYEKVWGDSITHEHLRRLVSKDKGVQLKGDTLTVMEMMWCVEVLKLNAIVSNFNKSYSWVPKKSDFQQDGLDFVELANGHWSVHTKSDYSGNDIGKQPVRASYGKGVSVENIGQVEEIAVLEPLPARVLKLERALKDIECGRVTYDELVEIHKALFPGVILPRFFNELKSIEESTRSKTNLGGSPQQKVMVERANGKAMVAGEKAHPLDEYNSFLNNVKSWANNTVKATMSCDELWPHRSPETANKNNLTVVDIVTLSVNNLAGVDKPNKLNRSGQQSVLVLSWCKDHINQAAEFVAAVALWLHCLDLTGAAWKVLMDTDFMVWNEDDWITNSKEVHDRWRKCGLDAGNDNDWAQMLYMQSLYGRGGVSVDWEKELSNKATPPDEITCFNGREFTKDEADSVIREAVRETVASAYPAAAPRDFNTFMDDAYEWLVSGSSAGIPSALKNSSLRTYILKDLGLNPRPTKRSVMEVIPRSKVLGILKTSPKIVAKAHMKLNETGGKARAIYGVTIWHYIFSNWLMAPLEKHLKHPYVDINISNKEFVEQMIKRVSETKDGVVYSSYDYPDFNSMHTHTHMSWLYSSAAEEALNCREVKSMPFEDQNIIKEAFKWLEDSVFLQVVIHPETGSLVQTVGGLYSGNRDTTLINTILNIAYSKVVDASMVNLNMKTGVISRLCHGDDIITTMQTYGQALAWNEVATKCNLKGQEVKLLTDQSYHEYLRVLGCKDGKLRGCLARSCATFVCGNWETDRVVGFDSKLHEIYSNLAVLERRGVKTSKVQALWKKSFERAAERFRWNSETTAEQWKITMGIEGNKINMIRSGNEDKNGSVGSVDNGKNKEDTITYRGLPSEVTQPYMNRLLRKLPDWVEPNKKEVARLKNKLQQSTYGTELPVMYQDTNTGEIDLKVRCFNQTESKPVSVKTALKRAETYKPDWRVRNHIKAYHILLSTIKIPGGYSKVDVIAAITGFTTMSVRTTLELDGLQRSKDTNSDNGSGGMRLASEPASLLAQLNWVEQAWGEDVIENANDLEIELKDYARVLASEVFKY
ncbi:cap-pol fusion protein [Erysiphe necator associated mycovirus 1]|nr:cap-pol fusion protein [Erysiphe necator associated mycovirus 1]